MARLFITERVTNYRDWVETQSNTEDTMYYIKDLLEERIEELKLEDIRATDLRVEVDGIEVIVDNKSVDISKYNLHDKDIQYIIDLEKKLNEGV